MNLAKGKLKPKANRSMFLVPASFSVYGHIHCHTLESVKEKLSTSFVPHKLSVQSLAGSIAAQKSRASHMSNDAPTPGIVLFVGVPHQSHQGPISFNHRP